MTTLTNNPTLGMYVSAAVALVVVLGLLIYLWSLDRRVDELRRAVNERKAAPLSPPIEPVRPRRLVNEEQVDGT